MVCQKKKKNQPLHHRTQTKNPPASVTNTLWQHQMPITTKKIELKDTQGKMFIVVFCLFCFKETTHKDTISVGTQFYHIHY